MARGEAASASARPDSIKGLALSVADPAYSRLVNAEPVLRRLVPILIVAFLVTIGIGAVVQVLEYRRQALTDSRTDIEVQAELVGERLARRIGPVQGGVVDAQGALAQAVTTTARGRRIFVTDPLGVIAASLPRDPSVYGRHLVDIIGHEQPLTTFGAKAGVMEIELANGDTAFVAVRTIAPPLGQIAVLQGRAEVLSAWRADATLTVTLFATTGFVLLILGFAFHWQATRAREADAIFDTVRSRIDTALNSGRCGLWDWDVARGRIFWSHSMFEMIGLSPRDELLSFADVAALIHPDDEPLHVLAGNADGDGYGLADHVFRMRHAAGHWVWLRARCEFTRQHGDDGGHIVGIVVDITEQKDFAERTAAADMRLRDAIEAISEAFVVWDANNRLVVCNSKFQSLHELPDEAVQPGTPYRAVVAASSRPVVRTQPSGEDKADQDGETFEAELDDGRWLQISERRTKDGGFVSVGTDITLLKQQATELALLAQKYGEEKRRAEAASHAKSEFLANMSHELRTPLNAIIGFSEIMETGVLGPLGERYHEYCRDIHESGRYLLDVINDILDMSRIEAGRMRLVPESFDLGDVVAETLRIMAPRARDKGHALDIAVDAPLDVHADRRGIKQIILNLVSNAVKFTPDRGRIGIKAGAATGRLLISIEDNGIGIPEAAIKHIGRPFEQVQSQFTKNHQGSGLGLAIAKSLTELHGGRMQIRSAEGSGTTVTIDLPILAGAGRRAARSEPARLSA